MNPTETVQTIAIIKETIFKSKGCIIFFIMLNKTGLTHFAGRDGFMKFQYL